MKKTVRKILKNRLLKDSVLGTGFIFFLIVFFLKVSQIDALFELFDPVGQALSDVEFEDLVFSELRDIPPANEDIVIVNTGELTRAQIAAQLQIINQYKPAVVGIDIFFPDLKPDTLGDIMLSEALSQIDRLVMVSQAILYDDEEDSWNGLRLSHPFFQHGEHGIANLYTDAEEQHQFKVCRTFPPKLAVNGDPEYAFALKVTEKFDSTKFGKFMKFSDKEEEVINFSGNSNDFGQTKFGTRFYSLDVADVLTENFSPDLIEGKIVLFGFMGKDFEDRAWEDKFFTPLNRKFAGRSNPDMFGVVIHANIVAMLLDERYVGYQSDFSGVLLAIVVCFLFVWAFSWIYWRLPSWYDGITKVVQLISLGLIILLNIYVFHWFSYKLELTLAAACIALSGDSLEVYYGLLLNLFSKQGRKEVFKVHKGFKKRKKEKKS